MWKSSSLNCRQQDVLTLDGVLGQSWLTRFDYLIDVDRGQLILDGEIPPGTRIPLLLVDGRPAIRSK